MTTGQDKRTAALAAIERVSTLVERETADCHSSPMCRSCEIDLKNLATIREALAAPDARVAELATELEGADYDVLETWLWQQRPGTQGTLDILYLLRRCVRYCQAALAPGEPKEGE